MLYDELLNINIFIYKYIYIKENMIYRHEIVKFNIAQ